MANNNKITINLTFNEYEFRRVKLMGTNPIIYTRTGWIGKEVLIIPVPITVTDRLIEKQYNKNIGQYNITIESDTIIKKTVKQHTNVGRIYVPKELIGLDCIIIEAPRLTNF